MADWIAASDDKFASLSYQLENVENGQWGPGITNNLYNLLRSAARGPKT